MRYKVTCNKENERRKRHRWKRRMRRGRMHLAEEPRRPFSRMWGEDDIRPRYAPLKHTWERRNGRYRLD